MRRVDLPEVFTRGQAVAAGLSDFRLAGLVRRGGLVRVRPGVYSRPPAPTQQLRVLRHVAEARAALAHHTAGFALSHLTAAAVHGLPMPLGALGPVHVTAVAATQRSRTARGVLVHHCDSTLTSVAMVDELPTTTVGRTVADCLRTFGPRVSVPIADAALQRRLLTVDDILAELEAQRRWRGRPRALRSLRLVDGRRESWLESYTFVRFDQWGIDLPVPQVVVRDEFGAFLGRVDGGWLEQATVLEVDGASKYLISSGGAPDPFAALRQEKTRQDDLGNTGVQVVRCGLSDLLSREQVVRQRVADRRAAGSRAGFRGSFEVLDPTGLRCL